MFATTYFMAGWGGVSTLIFAVMAVLFTVVDSFYGNVKQSYYALLPVLGNIHGAPETILPATLGAFIHLVPLVWLVLKIMRWFSVVVGIFVKKYGLKAMPMTNNTAKIPVAKPAVLRTFQI
jgi:hypothetical protein